jgi:shikimate dehydrogenase
MVNGKTRVFVLLGSPVEHSVSPSMQNAAFRALGLNATYVPLRSTAEDVPDIIRIVARAGGGGNITLPYKQAAAAAITVRSPLVQQTGVCNTFWSDHDGDRSVVTGENTDVIGVRSALGRMEAPSTSWLVLGTGGSARAVCFAAREQGAAVAIRSRLPERKREFEDWVTKLGIRLVQPAECEVVINTTPLGLDPSDPLPISPNDVPSAVVALDLVYGVNGTRWSKAMAQRGARASDGREAVVAQGAAAFKCWFPEYDPPVEVMRAVVNATLR